MKRKLIIKHHSHHIWNGFILALVVAITGILLASTPFGRWLEEDICLPWLFKFRGAQPAPSNVVIVSIDQASATKLNLSNKPRKWPRILHAQLVNKLNQAGVRAIAFDIIFDERRNTEHNRQFADAMKQANNVILFQYLKQVNYSVTDTTLSANGIQIEQLIKPVKVLQENAFGLAPFPLPKIPAKVNHFLLYKPSMDKAPTMPVVMLQTYALSVYDDLYALLHSKIPKQLNNLPASAAVIKVNGSIHSVVKTLRNVFFNNPQLAASLLRQLEHSSNKMAVNKRNLLKTLIKTYHAPYSMYLNFYGPPQTIQTLSYHDVLTCNYLELAGKVVFVGFSEQLRPEQKDGFFTVFTEEHSGVDISGVEIIATAFANLLEQRTLLASSSWSDILILTVWAMILGVGLRLFPGSAQLPLSVLFAVIYCAIAYYTFVRYTTWLPLAVPVLWQVPLAMLGTLLWKYFDLQRERRNIRKAFGFHLPIDVVDQLAEGVEHITDDGQQVHGLVLASDAQQYTTLSEQLEPKQLHHLMNQYYETLFTPILKQHGVISDVVGDAALAIWAKPQIDAATREQACLAALAILDAVEKFNATQSTCALPTRMGLHCGEIVMGHVGAMDHYEYRAVGDIVNTATRIEALNKLLGTRILISDEVLESLDCFVTRRLGRFLLPGKFRPVTIHELIAHKKNQATQIFSTFEHASREFQAGNWQAAIHYFSGFAEEHPDDGPTIYFQKLCETYLKHPPRNWDGIIKIIQK